MDPLQRSPIVDRPDIDSDDDLAWGVGDGPPKPPPVHVHIGNLGAAQSPQRPYAPLPPAIHASTLPWPSSPLAPLTPAMVLSGVPAWSESAIASLLRGLESLSAPQQKAQPAYPPSDTHMRTYSPFMGGR